MLYESTSGLPGGFEGVRAHLKDLADLGVTALQLMPIGAFPAPELGLRRRAAYAPDAATARRRRSRASSTSARARAAGLFLDMSTTISGRRGTTCTPMLIPSPHTHTRPGAGDRHYPAQERPLVSSTARATTLLDVAEWTYNASDGHDASSVTPRLLPEKELRFERRVDGRGPPPVEADTADVHLVLDAQRRTIRAIFGKDIIERRWNGRHPIFDNPRGMLNQAKDQS